MTEESVLRELADFALREYHEGRTKPLSEFMEEYGPIKFSDSSPNYVVYDREQLWRWDGEEWVLVESRKEGEADGRDTREAPEDQS